VPESVEKPYEYYRDNVAKSMELFDELVRLGKPRVLFSSSASLYAFSDSCHAAPSLGRCPQVNAVQPPSFPCLAIVP